MDRILPLPQEAREALIRLYFDDTKEMHRGAKHNSENEHCLVRVYLGEETEGQQQNFHHSLCNFPMPLNMMEDLDSGIFSLTAEIAIVLQSIIGKHKSIVWIWSLN